MALCKLCHWGFDEGLLAASAKYQVILSLQLSAKYNIPAHLPTLNGKVMSLPKEQAFWPNREALKRHREDVYRQR
jgi:putative restriction endonuclease